MHLNSFRRMFETPSINIEPATPPALPRGCSELTWHSYAVAVAAETRHSCRLEQDPTARSSPTQASTQFDLAAGTSPEASSATLNPSRSRARTSRDRRGALRHRLRLQVRLDVHPRSLCPGDAMTSSAPCRRPQHMYLSLLTSESLLRHINARVVNAWHRQVQLGTHTNRDPVRHKTSSHCHRLSAC
jgi:hypothetical protein